MALEIEIFAIIMTGIQTYLSKQSRWSHKLFEVLTSDIFRIMPCIRMKNMFVAAAIL